MPFPCPILSGNYPNLKLIYGKPLIPSEFEDAEKLHAAFYESVKRIYDENNYPSNFVQKQKKEKIENYKSK